MTRSAEQDSIGEWANDWLPDAERQMVARIADAEANIAALEARIAAAPNRQQRRRLQRQWGGTIARARELATRWRADMARWRETTRNAGFTDAAMAEGDDALAEILG